MAIDPITASALITTGGSLLGSLAGGGRDTARDQRKQTLKLIKERGDAVREGARRSGFNPLTYLTGTASSAVGGGAAPSTPPLASIGAALQTFGNLAYQRATAEEQQKRTHESAMQQLERINELQNEAGGSSSVVTRTVGRLASDSAAQATDPVFAGEIIDANRDVDAADVMNTPGANVVQNDWTFGPLYLPGAEPPEADEMIVTAPLWVPQLTRNIGEHVGNVMDARKAGNDMADAIKRQKTWKERRAFGVGFNQSQAQDYRSRRQIMSGY